jgi:hypothetical protein
MFLNMGSRTPLHTLHPWKTDMSDILNYSIGAIDNCYLRMFSVGYYDAHSILIQY